ncbi:MAG TPA: phytase, partial [Acidimicrobiales bacterium]|nr:phytase [Acidimicrobiales bacterium]
MSACPEPLPTAQAACAVRAVSVPARGQNRQAKGSGWKVSLVATFLGVVVATLVVAPPPASAAISRTQVVAPAGDAFVSAARPRTNFGSAGELRVDGRPRERAYVRFRLPTLHGKLTRATLQVFARTTSSQGYVARGMSGPWSERSVTFTTPVGLAAQRTASGPVRGGVYKNIDVTTLARGRATLNVALTTGATRRVRLASREFVGRRPPRLVLTTVPFDTTPPETTITGGPTDLTRSASASFRFAASERGSRLQCRLDTGAFEPCSSPKDYTGLEDGVHLFATRAIDAAGNPDPTPARRIWTIDSKPPEAPLITSPAGDGTTRARTVVVSGTAEAHSSVELFEGPTSKGITTSDTDGRWSLELTNLTEGDHSYTATASDAAGNTSAASSARTVTVDTTQPETTIDSGPSATTNSRSAQLAFSSSEHGSTFECRLDAGAFAPCDSPKDYADLPDGQHTFEVRATDAAGNLDATPTSRTWTVDGTPPSASISSPPSGTTYTSAQAVQIEAAVSPDTQRVEFYDNGARKGSEDTDPFAFSWSIDQAENGTHSWTIKAFDAAGNVSAESAPVTLDVNIAGGGGGTSRSVTASAETAPVAGSGDAADDPAVWLHPTDTSKSTIIGTEKVDGGGIVVYDLAGNQLHKYSDTKPNNVDLRYNFPLGGERVGLVAASNNQSTKTLRLYKVDPSTRGLEHVSAREIATGVAAGLCMYHSPTSGKYYAFIGDNSGTVQQWELSESSGKVDATKVRTLRLGSTTEGCVADDETGDLYISEEDVAIWKYGAEPTDGATTADRTKVDDLTGDGGHLTNDIEGLSIYYGNGGTGYLLASSQGSSDYAVYDRQSGDYVTRFSVVDGAVDGSSYTDGIDVTNFPLGGAFPEGMFVAQDDKNTSPSANQNFKLVPWGQIARGGSPALKVDTSWDPRQVGAPPGGDGGGGGDGSGPTTYYVDSADGSDTNAGTSEGAAWRTLDKASTADLSAGDRLLLERGGAWTGQLEVTESGTADKPIEIGAYGSGAAPKVTGSDDCVELAGAFVTVKDVHVDDCRYAGISVRGDDNHIEGTRMTGNIAGVYVRSGASRTKILDSDLVDNDKMSDSACGGPGDSGAFAILLHGDHTEIARNEISGSDAYSCEYGRDGAAVEVYGGTDNDIHHNLAVDNDIFTELGEAGSANNTFAYNVVRSSLADSRFLVTRGAEGTRGPVLGTKAYNNTVRLTGATSQGFVCHDGCSSDILRMRNNIVEAV